MPAPPAIELEALLRRSEWFMAVLEAARAVAAPDWWIGAGALRDVVCDTKFGRGSSPELVKDIDLAFYDADDLSREREAAVEAARRAAAPRFRSRCEESSRGAPVVRAALRDGRRAAPLVRGWDRDVAGDRHGRRYHAAG